MPKLKNMGKRGPKRKTRNLPNGIKAEQLPDRVYWNPNGNGCWYTQEKDSSGKRRSKRIAGSTATLSDLHRIMDERKEGADSNSFDYLALKFRQSPAWSKLSAKSQKNYDYAQRIVTSYKTKIGDLGAMPLQHWMPSVVQRIIDRLAETRGPSAANEVLRYVRRVFTWARQRGHYNNDNPASRLDAPKERKRRILPTDDAMIKLINYSSDGNGPTYIWLVLEFMYLCRMRGIEALELTDGHEQKEGLLIQRRKGSRDNITEWNDRLRDVWSRAKARRDRIVEKRKMPVQVKPEHRYLFLADRGGGRLTKDGFDTAWNRFINKALNEGIISAEQRFSPHGMKHKGTTETEGTRADKKDAGGWVTDAMVEVYDHELKVVKPAGKDK